MVSTQRQQALDPMAAMIARRGVATVVDSPVITATATAADLGHAIDAMVNGRGGLNSDVTTNLNRSQWQPAQQPRSPRDVQGQQIDDARRASQPTEPTSDGAASTAPSRSYQEVLEQRAMLRMATSIEDGNRFDPRERKALWDAVSKAPPNQIEDLIGHLKNARAVIPQRELSGRTQHQSLWQRDDDFRGALLGYANHILAGNPVIEIEEPPALAKSQRVLLIIDAAFSESSSDYTVADGQGGTELVDVDAEVADMKRVRDGAVANGVQVVKAEWPGLFRTTEALARAPGQVDLLIEKDTRSAFGSPLFSESETGLAELLWEIGAREIHVMGSFQDQCVAATVKDLVARGYQVIVHEGLTQPHDTSVFNPADYNGADIRRHGSPLPFVDEDLSPA